MPDYKLLQLPNGHRTTSDRIRKVRVFPERPPSLCRVWVELFEEAGLVYQGLIDLDQVVVAGGGRSEHQRESATSGASS